MIGIFDSGVGGLTVAREIKKRLPKRAIIYFGDTARVPWGNKSREVISAYAVEICDFLISKGSTEIVIACNTASAFAGDYLREKYPHIRIHNVIEPVIEKISIKNESEVDMRIGVIGTRGTIFSEVYDKKIKEIDVRIEVYSKACPLFVSLVEEGFSDSKIADLAIEQCLQELKDININKLVLGCTHYPMLRNTISNFLGKDVEIIGSDDAIAEKLFAKDKDSENKSDKNDQDCFYFSDLSGSYLELATNIYGKEIKVEKIVL